MDIADELAELLTALDSLDERVERWESLEAGARRAPVSGNEPNAQEERSVRHAAAALARIRAREVRDELAEVRARTRRAADRFRDAARTCGAARGTGAGESMAAMRPVAAALRSAATGLVTVENGEQAMDRIVTGALRMVPSAQWGGMCLEQRSGKRAASPAVGGGGGGGAASDPVVERLEAIQARENEGPCVDALSSRATISVPDLDREQRWPGFRRAAATFDVRSAVAVGLPVPPPGGVLTLYSSRPGAFDDDTVTLVEMFADHAAIALAGARRLGALQQAVDTRDVIGQAKGRLMEQHGITADRAFAMLVEASQHANLKLTHIARWVADGMPGTSAPRDGTVRE